MLLIADSLKIESLACPLTKTFEEIQTIDMSDSLELNLFAIKYNCKFLNNNASIEVINYDVNSRSKLLKIYDKSSHTELYILRKNVTIEQPGNNNSFKF